MSFRKIGLVVAVLFISLFVGLLALFFSREKTRYCPVSHWTDPMYSCRVADRSYERILIEHVQIEGNILELSIRENGSVRWIKHPDRSIPGLSPVIFENSIHFDRQNANLLVVNGKSFPVEPI
jgi:hypothetical protein